MVFVESWVISYLKNYNIVVKEICGYMFNFFNLNDFKKLFGIIVGVFVGVICFESGGSNSVSGKKRWSVWGFMYSIIVDDFIEKIFIIVVR